MRKTMKQLISSRDCIKKMKQRTALMAILGLRSLIHFSITHVFFFFLNIHNAEMDSTWILVEKRLAIAIQ